MSYFFSTHLVVFLVASIIFLAFTFIYEVHINESNFITLLNGMGFMTSFFILVIDKINLKRLRASYSKNVSTDFKRREITQGNKMLNTIFSMTLSMFFLLGAQYLLLFFGITQLFLLVLLVMYVFGSFILILMVWHGIEMSNVS